jgi:hypothetical protein
MSSGRSAFESIGEGGFVEIVGDVATRSVGEGRGEVELGGDFDCC